MKIRTIKPAFVDIIPDHLDEGILYISERYRTMLHKCCCGCGEEVVTPLSPADWRFSRSGNMVSIFPSIGNWSFKCKSHYWIKNNTVYPSVGFSDKEIERVRKRDQMDKERYIAYKNAKKPPANSGFVLILNKFQQWLNKLF